MNRFEDIARKVNLGDRITEADALYLFEDFHDLSALGQLAESCNFKINQDIVYYNINRHINPTNICALSCKFCAYSRKINEPGAYAYSIETMVEKAGEAVRQGATEVHMVGGLHPRWTFSYYLDMIRAVKEAFPQIHIKAFTAVELDWLARKSRQGIPQVLETLKNAGLGSLPGGGAEIFDPEVRDLICDTKVSAEQWLDTHRTAHRMGLHSNATMLYGHIEKPHHRVDHMARLRALQDETHGFNAFIPLAFQPFQNEMGINRYTLGIDDLKTLAIARIFLDNFRHIKAYWIMLGQDIAQVGLNFGANDLDGTVIEEKISRMAGGRSGMALSRSLIKQIIQRAGRIPVERDTLYQPLEALERRAVRLNPAEDRTNAEALAREIERSWQDSAGDKPHDGDSLARIKEFEQVASLHLLAHTAQKKLLQNQSKTLTPQNPRLEVSRGRSLFLECTPLDDDLAGKIPESSPQGSSTRRSHADEGAYGKPSTQTARTPASTPFRLRSDLNASAPATAKGCGDFIENSPEALKNWYRSLPSGGDGSAEPDIYLDLSGLCDHVGEVRGDFLKECEDLVRNLQPLGRPVHLLALKTLWRLCHPTRKPEQELLELVGTFRSWGIVSIQSSSRESEMDLTSSEIATLHRAIRQGGLWSIGKLEVVAPSLEGSAVLGESRPLWEAFLKRAEILGQLVYGEYGLRAVRVEVAPSSFVTAVDYLRALAMARLALPVGAKVIAPFLSIPSMGLAKGEGSQAHQHPAEKVAALVSFFGAQSLGALDGQSVSAAALLNLIEESFSRPSVQGTPVVDKEQPGARQPSQEQTASSTEDTQEWRNSQPHRPSHQISPPLGVS